MAHMIPPQPLREGGGAYAEGLVFDALATQLDDSFFVYHGLHFLKEDAALEGEADLLVLHRELGLLNIEVKGWGVKRSGMGEWTREEHGTTTTLRQDPFSQAQDSLHRLVKVLEKKSLHYLNWRGTFPLPFGYAVAFPLARKADGNLPLDIPRELLYDADDIARLGERVRATMAFWKRARPDARPLDGPDFDRLRRKVLHPQFKLVHTLGAACAAGEASLVRLTDEQAWVAGALLENRHFRVRGGAGTGKTALALEVARRLAESGQSTLLLCYNRALGAHLARIVEGWGLEPDRARATFFHDLCRQAMEGAGRAFVEPQDPYEKQSFYNDISPYQLLNSVLGGGFPKWDAIVVDEGQDFAEGWWVVVRGLLKAEARGQLFAFYDPPQAIFGRPSSVSEELPVLSLSLNLRNTKAIARYLQRFAPDLTPHPRAEEGPPVGQWEATSSEAVRRKIEELVMALTKTEGLRPEQIAILTPHRLEHSSLSGLSSLGGCPLATDPMNRDGGLLHATISGFKGLESDAVILADVNHEDPRCSPADLYVAASRAKHVLNLVGIEPRY